MELLKEQLGAEGQIVIEIKGGKLIMQATHNHASGSAKIEVAQDAGYFFDKLAKAIPGVLDDALLALIKDAVKNL